MRDRGVGFPCGAYTENQWVFSREPGPEDGHLPPFVRIARELRRTDKDQVLGQPLDLRALNTVVRMGFRGSGRFGGGCQFGGMNQTRDIHVRKESSHGFFSAVSKAFRAFQPRF